MEEIVREIRSYIPRPYMASFNTIVNGSDWWKEEFLVYYRDLIVKHIELKKGADPHSIVLPSPLYALDRFLKEGNYSQQKPTEETTQPEEVEEVEMAEEVQEGETFDDISENEVVEETPVDGEAYEESWVEEPEEAEEE